MIEGTNILIEWLILSLVISWAGCWAPHCWGGWAKLLGMLRGHMFGVVVLVIDVEKKKMLYLVGPVILLYTSHYLLSCCIFISVFCLSYMSFIYYIFLNFFLKNFNFVVFLFKLFLSSFFINSAKI